MVGLGDAQTAQLNLLNPGVEPPAAGAVCSAAVSFVDADGNVLKSMMLNVAPGKSMAFNPAERRSIFTSSRGIAARFAPPLAIRAIFPPTATAFLTGYIRLVTLS